MKHLGRLAVLTTMVILALAGCGGTAGTTSTLPMGAIALSRAHHSGSSGDLLYVSDLAGNDIRVFRYPQLGLVRTISGIAEPRGLCSDANGDVFVTSYQGNNVLEFAHGARTPMATLGTPGSPEACSIDPTTGNLAVTFVGSGALGVAVFPNASGTPSVYDAPLGSVFWYCGYDDSGNLFIDGQSQFARVAIWELPFHSNNFLTANIQGGELYDVAQLQWDGKNMTIEDVTFDTISPITFSYDVTSPTQVNALVGGATTFDHCGYDDARQSWSGSDSHCAMLSWQTWRIECQAV
jgi:hypothetical protein